MSVTFESLNLSNPLRNALADLNITTATTIQERAFAPILSGRDIMGIAQTGTGKTFAYLLPILRNLKYSEQKFPRILILVPTRELVIQVVSETEKLAAYMTLRVQGVYGGANINTQKERVYEGMDVLVATPGRLIDLVVSGVLRLKNIQKLVIDEVDEMLNLGFRPQLIRIFDFLPEKRQNLMFSATMIPEVEALIKGFFNDPIKIEAAATGTPLSQIKAFGYHIPNYFTKLNLLEFLLEEETLSKVLIFVSNKKLADQLFDHLEEMFPEKVGVIHSNKSQNYRFRAVQDFEAGTTRLLIATDLVARGVDVSNISHVINFDLPESPESYMHRIGRTGRADKQGVAISFITLKDQTYQAGIEKLTGVEMNIVDMPEEVSISPLLTDDEIEKPKEINYLPKAKKVEKGGGAFHEKKDKNQKVNMGGSYRRKLKEKYKKPKTRGQKKK